MKYLILPLFLVPLLSLSQECKLIRQTDPFTKLTTLSTGFIQLQGASLTIDASRPEIDLLFSISGVDKCFTDQSMAAIYFVGTKAKQNQRNGGSMNCEGLFHLIFRNGPTPHTFLKKMASQKIEKIIFTGNNKMETTITLTPDQQQVVMELTSCMVKEAPSLL